MWHSLDLAGRAIAESLDRFKKDVHGLCTRMRRKHREVRSSFVSGILPFCHYPSVSADVCRGVVLLG